MAESQVYLFTGPEIGEKFEAISTIKEKARKTYGDLDEYSYYATESRVVDVISQLQNGGLFSSSLFVVLKSCEVIKSKADIECLVSYIKNSGESQNTLILVSDEKSIDKKIENAVPSNCKKIFWEMFDDKKEVWLQSFFKKNGYSITDEAVEDILEMIENNTDSLKTECSRFFYCFEKGHQINCKDVEKILSHNREESAFTLFDAIVDNSKSQKARFEDTIAIWNKIHISKDNNTIALIAGLTYCFRMLREWINLHKTPSVSETQLKAKGFTSKTAQQKYTNAAKIYKTGEVAAIIALLADTDMKLRETGSAFEDVYITQMLHSIVMKKGLFPSTYELD